MFRFKHFESLTDGEIKLVLEGTSPQNKTLGHVPSYKFYITLHDHQETIVGKIDLRIGFNEHTYYSGHIGYEVYKPYRGNHYAAKACKIIKQVAKAHEMDTLYITCNPDNIASQKTCIHAGLTLIKIIDIPSHIDLYKYGEKQKCLFEWILNKE
ncbi:GNAT family N-acetyltransferase [Haloplasma contractile]|uniref:Tagatose 16-diphosphate aldolase protein n=1 Tax=Haloplasma contractile SSD-17B TaxID=1033810 RepID=U2FGN5_9MOLU|nr:GNAT family N-acetyltransferase [Haloplasma contractile]ERJ12010.1 tagatose 16-diphosphate aldolase protein [Haloplasma contractile SSD-17B]